MGLCGKIESEVEIRASASKFHEIFHKRTHHISKVSTDMIHGIDLHEGEWGKIGSIICWRYLLGLIFINTLPILLANNYF